MGKPHSRDAARQTARSSSWWGTFPKYFVLVAVLALAVRVWTAFTATLPISGDEIAHGNYIGHIVDHHGLPDSAVANAELPEGRPGLARLSYEYYQPPGYYIVTALLGGGTPIGSRMVSVAMFMIALCFIWAATRGVGRNGDMAVLCAMAFLPGLVITTSTINNDVFLFMGSAILLYACAGRKTWAYILGGIVLATSKFHGFPILLVVGTYFLVKKNYRWGIIGLAFAAVAGGIAYWRWDLQVENEGIRLVVPTVSGIIKTLRETLTTGFWNPHYDNIPIAYLIPATLGGLVVVGLAVYRFRRLTDIHKYVILVVCLVWVGWSIFKQYPTGRYLFAALPWFAVLGKGKQKSPSLQRASRKRTHRK